MNRAKSVSTVDENSEMYRDKRSFIHLITGSNMFLVIVE